MALSVVGETCFVYILLLIEEHSFSVGSAVVSYFSGPFYVVFLGRRTVSLVVLVVATEFEGDNFGLIGIMVGW